MTPSLRAVLLAIGLVVTGCAAGDDNGIPADCGIPTPAPKTDVSLVPEAFLLDGRAEAFRTQRIEMGYAAAFSIPLSVGEGLRAYRAVVEDEGFEILLEDNEGFEAEIYIRRGERLGTIQIRRSLCEDASVAFLNVVTVPEQPLRTPTPSRASPS